MTHTPHELAEEFPELADEISRRKREDLHFARLCDEYHRINRAVHRAETLVEPTDRFHEEEMRKQRAALKDELYRLLNAG